MVEEPTKEEIILDLQFSIYGVIVLLKDYANDHIKKKSRYNSILKETETFDEIKSLKRLKRTAKNLDNLLSEYSKYILD